MKFEYKVDTCWGDNSEHQSYLNRKGEDGWELVSVNKGGGTFATYTFKRLKKEV